MLTQFLKNYRYCDQIIRQSSSSTSCPTFMLGRCFGIVAYKQPGIAPLRLIISSLPIHARGCPSISTSVFVSFSFPQYMLHHHSFTHTFFFTSHYMSLPLNLPTCIFLDISPTFVVSLMLSFLNIFSFVTPDIHLHTHFHHFKLLLL